MGNLLGDSAEAANLPPHLLSLTSNQRAFVEAFLETGNQSEAARRAGYGGPGNKYAAQRGCELMKLPKIKEAINKEQAEMGHGLRTKAINFWNSVMDNPNTGIDMLKIKMAASKEIADRYNLPKTNKTEKTVTHEFENMPQDELLAYIRAQTIALKIVDVTPEHVMEKAQRETYALPQLPQPPGIIEDVKDLDDISDILGPPPTDGHPPDPFDKE